MSLSSPSFGGGRYEVTRKLGEGGKGIVYQARDRALDRIVAIKQLKRNALDDESLGRFLSEARTLARLTHPNITTIYDLGEEDGQHYVILEFIDGGDLAHRLDASPNRRLPPRDIVRIAADVCRGLDHAHRAGVLHRDIKPENIMLTSGGEVKLSDFGLAARVATAPEAGMIVGTVPYLPPEAATGQARGPQSDLYSLGAVMYEMAIGRPPFRGDDVAVIYSHIHDAPVPPRSLNADVPESLASLILRLLAKRAEQRPSSAAAFLGDLAAISESAGEGAPPEPAPAPAASPSRLVDREPELARLRRALADLRAGRGGLLMLTGEAGIGKTRLALELASPARQEGITFLAGHAGETPGAAPLEPWIEALRSLVTSVPPQLLYKYVGIQAGVLARILPDLPAKLGPALPTVAVERELERFQLFDAVTQFLANASREAPLLVFLDDLHWADEATLQLLDYATRNASTERILFLGSYRPEDVARAGALESTLYELNRTRRLERIHLPRLVEDDVRTLVARTLQSDRVDPKLLSIVNERSGGNPFFIEELVLALRDEGHIRIEDGVARWSGGAVRMPDSVHHLIQRRVARLSEAARELLLKASVLGRHFRPDVLARMAGVERDVVLDLLEEVLRTGLIVEDTAGSETRIVFRDPQVRDCLYESISGMRRQRYHERAAEALSALPSTSTEELAHHYALADLPESARKYLEAAGDEAMGLSSFDRAAEAFERAASFWPREEREPRRRLLVKLGDAYSSEGKWAWAKEAYIEARRLVARPEDDVAIAVRLGPALWYLGDVPAARQELEQALRTLGSEATTDAAEALNWLATIHADEGNPEGLLKAAERALEIATHLGNRAEMSFALNNLAFNEAVRGRWEMCGVYLSQQFELSKEGSGLYDLGNACDDYAVYYTLFLPDYPRALEYSRQAIEIAQRIGNRPSEVRWRLHRGWTYRDMGRWDDAESEAAALQGLAEELYENMVPWILLFRGEVAGFRGDLTAADQIVRRALESAGADVWWRLHFLSHANTSLAWIRLEAGDADGAGAAIREAGTAQKGHLCRWCGDRLFVVAASILAHEARGDARGFDEAVNEVRQTGSPPSRAAIVAVEARWERLRGAPTLDRFEAAEKYFRSVGKKFELAALIHEHALTLLALGRSTEGNPRLEEALQQFLDLGAKKRVEDVLRSKRLVKA